MASLIKPQLNLYLAAPRGFCAGVDRAIRIVEESIRRFGTPVYVRHEIVHNRYVVEGLKAMGAIFVEELEEIPDTNRPVIFSAHGVAKSVPEDARARGMFHIDATCPLVTKVHREAENHHEAGREVVLIGHAGHPEVVGTMGQLPQGAMQLVETIEEARNLAPETPENMAYITQTTLSVEDTKLIVGELKSRFPTLNGPKKEDICYATTNRQAAVKAIAMRCDAMIVMGAPNSSNSRRLVEVARREGCKKAWLIERASDIPFDSFAGIKTLGLSAGASAPEVLIDDAIEAIKARYETHIEIVVSAEENITFGLPRELRNAAEEA